MATINDLSRLTFELLRKMDEEATTISEKGEPTGLSDYGRHARPELKKPQCEVEWSRRLGELLRPHFSGVEAEFPYPSYALLPNMKRQRCDLVITLSDGQRVWLEIKGAWRDYWGGQSGIYRCYLLFPLDPSADAGKSHTVPFDLQKLGALQRPDAHHVAELLIGFEKPDDPMGEDIQTLTDLAGLSDWAGSTDTWDSPTVAGQRVRTWLWHREIV